MTTATVTATNGPNTHELRLVSTYGMVTRTVLDTPVRDALPSEIPVIDVSGIFSDSLSDRQAVAARVRQASTTNGFFYIKNHGVPQAVIHEAYEASLDFFRQPLDRKMPAAVDPSKYEDGYKPPKSLSINADEGIDVREGFIHRWDYRADPQTKHLAEVPADAASYLCDNFDAIAAKMAAFPRVVPAVRAYFESSMVLARALTHTFALSMGVPEDYFDSKIVFPESATLVNYYPPLASSPYGMSTGGDDDDDDDKDTAAVSIGSHTDFMFFTLLWQDRVGGLQVLNEAGQWIHAPPLEDTLVVNVADFMQRVTNDHYKSGVHRALNMSSEERISMPMFMGMGLTESCGVLDECLEEGEEAKYAEVKIEEWVNRRMAALFQAKEKKVIGRGS